MKRLTATLCLTLTVLIGSAGVSWSDDFERAKAAFFNGNYRLALEIMTPLADEGLWSAQAILGGIFSKGGDGVPKNETKSAKYYELAAEQGLCNAQYNTAANYSVGRGVIQDFKATEYWYTKCAEQNSDDKDTQTVIVLSRHFLADMYYHGTKIPQNYAKAKYWYVKEIEYGSQGSMNNLGVMYANGEGVLQDNFSAHMWFNIAASMGDKDAAKYRDQIINSMTPADISTAQKLARECVRKEYKGC